MSGSVSQHHQTIGEVGAGWRVCAREDEGLIEGIEQEQGFALGVQWHPELSHWPATRAACGRAMLRAQ